MREKQFKSEEIGSEPKERRSGDRGYTETPSFRTIHIPDRGHFVRLIPAPKFTCSGIFLVRNLHVPKNYCPVNSCIYDKF